MFILCVCVCVSSFFASLTGRVFTSHAHPDTTPNGFVCPSGTEPEIVSLLGKCENQLTAKASIEAFL